MSAAPRPRVVDHLRVAWLLVLTVAGVIPILLSIVTCPLWKPWVRARLRRRLQGDAGSPDEPPRPDPDAWAGRTVFLVAGEASGDRMAAPVVRRMLALCPGLTVRGYGGPASAEAGAVLDRNLVDHAVVGVTAVARSLGFWWSVCAETLARLREEPPDLFLTVDFPGLNARLARWARKRGVYTVHLVAPAVWAYAPWRVFRWRLAIDRMLTTFPFEAVLFQGSGIPSTFVGHPLFEAPLPVPRTSDAWPGDGACRIELLPGSRRQEIRGHAPLLLDAAALVEERLTTARPTFVVRLADPEHLGVFEEAARDARRRPDRLVVARPGPRARAGDGAQAGAQVVAGGEAQVVAQVVADGDALADAEETPLLGALASSGTVTAELGATLVPMAIVYRVTWLTRFGVSVGLTAPYIGLANLIAGRRVVPERIQVSSDGRPMAEAFLAAAGDRSSWEATRAALDEGVRRRIAIPAVAERAARAVLQHPPEPTEPSESQEPAKPPGDTAR